MKKTIIALCILATCSVHAQTLFTYGNHAVSKAEFLRAYNKNNTNTSNTEKAYRDYLDLYTRFKLKVQAAYDAKLDTLRTQGTELTNFRAQIVDNYMSDESSVQALVDEAFIRSQKDLRVSHIYIPFTGGDTLAAFQKATEAYNKIQAGADFASIAENYSADPSVHNSHGDLGYITALTLPYEFESIVYATPVGTTARPYRSNRAYHVFKTTAERPAIGRMKAAQILVGFMPNADQGDKEKKKILADSIYLALQQGASFQDMVAKYSTDNISYQSGGLLPEFGAGRYDEAFESAAFSLTKDGEISHPVATEFGYHIIRRVQRIPANKDSSNKEEMSRLRQMVLADKRITLARQMLSRKAMKIAGYKAAAYDDRLLKSYADSLYANRKPQQLPAMNDKTILFSFPEQKITAGDFAKYINSIHNNPEMMRGKSTPQILQQYADGVALEYYRQRLERYNTDFANQLKEFKDGNLLFEIMQRQVWDKAAADSTGLRNFYNSHKDKYWWEASADAILFTCSDSASAVRARTAFAADHNGWKNLVQNSDGTIQADSGRFELSQLPALLRDNPKEGNLSEPVKNATDNISSFGYLIRLYKNRMPRSFEDARGFVINDYQSFLEDRWIDTLRKKYPVKVNEAVLASCWK